MKITAFLLLAFTAQVAAFQPASGNSRPATALDMGKKNRKNKPKKAVPAPTSQSSYLETLAQQQKAGATVVENSKKETVLAEESIAKVANSAKGIGKLFQDLGEEVATLGGEVASSVAGSVQAKWDSQRLNKLQQARLGDVLEELTELKLQWDTATIDQREQVLEEAFTTTFKLLQTVQNQQDGVSEMMSEDIMDLEALATQRIVLKKPTKKEDLSKLAP